MSQEKHQKITQKIYQKIHQRTGNAVYKILASFSMSGKNLRPALLPLALFLPLLLSGCHGSRETADFSVPEAFDETKNYEITFWAKNDTNKLQTDIYKKAIDDFQKLYPNITVQLRLYTNYGKIYNDVITNIATNTTPLRSMKKN